MKKYNHKPKPWTDDEILQRYRFCNVRRMDDNVSQWLLKNWYKPYKDHPNMLAACTLARHFNVPEALQQITTWVFDGWEPNKLKSAMRNRKAAGKKIFNGAYMVRGIGEIDKTEMVVTRVVQPLIDNPPKINNTSMELTVAALLPYWGLSDFMAGQVVADLRHAMTGTWRDKHYWAAIGPGSQRGMNRLHRAPTKRKIKQSDFNTMLGTMINKASVQLSSTITSRLEAIDWQNCLCEYDKYTRALLGEGQPKQRYQGV
jgi:hypothetical protein